MKADEYVLSYITKEKQEGFEYHIPTKRKALSIAKNLAKNGSTSIWLDIYDDSGIEDSIRLYEQKRSY